MQPTRLRRTPTTKPCRLLERRNNFSTHLINRPPLETLRLFGQHMLTEVRIVKGVVEQPGEILDVIGVEERVIASGYLGHRRCRRAEHRCLAGNHFCDRQAEALFERWHDTKHRLLHQRNKFIIGDLSREPDVASDTLMHRKMMPVIKGGLWCCTGDHKFGGAPCGFREPRPCSDESFSIFSLISTGHCYDAAARRG